MPDEIDDMSGLPSLYPDDFEGNRLKRSGRVLVFFYARWCPYCRKACKETDCIMDKGAYEAYSVDISEESNPLWGQLSIDVVPTLIGYDNGEEIYRKQAGRMLGLKRTDFEKADAALAKS